MRKSNTKEKLCRVIAMATSVMALLTASASSHAFTIMGAGAQSCETFIGHIGKSFADGTARQMEDVYFSWAQGWMSQQGRKRDSKGEKQADLNPPGFGYREQQAFLRNTCAAEPRIKYRDAVDRLYDRLLQMSAQAA